MNLLCKFGSHSWDGCVCSKCGKTRVEFHSWNGCLCSKCGKTRDESHSWDGCICLKCSKIRDSYHSWNGCMCSKCGETKDEHHEWKGLLCSRCGKIRRDVNKRFENGRTLLHLAAMKGHEEEVKNLINEGSDVHAKDDYGYTPLHLAEYNSVAGSLNYQGGSYSLTCVFLERNGANVNAKDNEGLTPSQLRELAYEVEALKQLKEVDPRFRF